MTSRERVLKALNFEEPDRVPIDLGGTYMSGIMAHALDRLRRHLGYKEKPVKVCDVFQMLGEVEADIVERLGVDVLPVEPLVQLFGLRRERYKPWRLCDGTEVLVPGDFQVEVDSAGNYLLHEEGNIDTPVVGRMPKNGFYFDMLALTEMHSDFKPPTLSDIEKENHMDAESLEFTQARSEKLRKETDKALLLDCGSSVGLEWVGSIPDFLCLLALDPAYVKDLFAIRTDTAIKNMEKLKQCLGDSIDIFALDGGDYGSQRGELFAPDLFAELFVPFLREQNDWVHGHTNWKTWQHTCGSVAKLLPMLVETHIDIINPVQCSAAGMDPQCLKDRFGRDLVFWGGAVDTQKTLPFGTTDDVIDEVVERIRCFAPGGGFVFNPIHNIQQGTPPQNIVAAFDAAMKEGRYPIANSTLELE